MEKRASHQTASRCLCDGAILGLRLFAGTAILLHNIGKIQNYNEIIGSYPVLLHMDAPTVFTLLAILEVTLATLLILGIRVRTAALLLAVGAFVKALQTGAGLDHPDFVWTGIFLLIAMAGSGSYTLEPFLGSSYRKK